MAYLVHKSGIKKLISAEQGVRLWKAWRNMEQLEPALKARVADIEAIHLNYYDAPAEYVYENMATILPVALRDWVVDPKGKPKKPGCPKSWAFARQYGLWERGGPSNLVLFGAAVPAQTSLTDRFKVND